MYPDTHPKRYHISNLRHTILQRNLIHNHFRQRGEHRERYTDSGRPTETNIRRDPSRSALRLQATADPTGNLSQRFKTVCQPEGPANKPLPQLIAPGSLLFEQKKRPPGNWEAVHKPRVAGCYGAEGGVYAHPERSSGFVEQEPGTGAKKNAARLGAAVQLCSSH